MARLLCSESPLAVHDPLPAWIRGLERWGAPVQVRAALAAAWVAWAEWKSSRHCLCMGSNINPPWRECTNCGGTGDHDPRPRYALRAADAWLACPCERHRREWYERQVDTVEAMGTGIWIPNPDDEPHILAQRPLKAAERASPEAVRAAIRAELGRWALA